MAEKRQRALQTRVVVLAKTNILISGSVLKKRYDAYFVGSNLVSGYLFREAGR